VPLSLYWISSWLNNFAYRMGINYWVFILPIIGILIIVLLTTLPTILKVIFINPVDVLKDE
jgi:putative ABC transport system permease protein